MPNLPRFTATRETSIFINITKSSENDFVNKLV